MYTVRFQRASTVDGSLVLFTHGFLRLSDGDDDDEQTGRMICRSCVYVCIVMAKFQTKRGESKQNNNRPQTQRY